MPENMTEIDIVLDYHQQTKHHINRPSRSLGYMDWNNQPNPFRRYQGTSSIDLEHGEEFGGPLYRELFTGNIPPKKVDYDSISQLFYYSMALSAWKQVPGGAAWPLRVNPSSGNLHPTESYLITGAQASPEIETGLYHYRPDCHALEKRRSLDAASWATFEQALPPNGFFVGLSSIYWRETWKYGERGFRYCHHDVGHAIGAITIAALSLGWRAVLVDTIDDETLSHLLGCEDAEGIEAEHPDCLIAIDPMTQVSKESTARSLSLSQDFLHTLSAIPSLGKENQLSEHHHDWPIIERVSTASRKKGNLIYEPVKSISRQDNPKTSPEGKSSAFQIIRQRRSAVAMDGVSSLDRSDFYGILQRLQPGDIASPFSVLSWASNISLFLFVHRVTGLDSGLYVLVRNPRHFDLLKTKIRSDFHWKKPENCPASLNLYLLTTQDVRQVSKSVSCAQDIAADGAFSLGMLAQFESVIREGGAHFYPRLFWEAGLIGQLLYLEAEAIGLQGTGIGCFFDDDMHDLLGLQDQSWQSLYHFTVGGPVEDNRLQTKPAYHHLKK